MDEPGLDLHAWETTWASVAEDKDEDPEGALSQLADLVREVLVSRGYEVDDPVERTGDEPELVQTYLAAREVAERAEVGTAARDEVESAIEDLEDVFRAIVEERPG
jgi:hypothetical protein